MDGYIHSIETFGTVDGPGIRFVIFMQGCPLRCRYCHNPDTWNTKGGKQMSAEEILEQFNKNRSFYTKGGITVTGGEPLLQIDFLCELFQKAKEQDIHTCIDTSGITYRRDNLAYIEKLDELMRYTDLVMLDIKHIDREAHRDLTGADNAGILEFAQYLEKKQIPVWIRHVVVPGINDKEEYLLRIGRFIGGLSNVKALDVLPYHTMGIEKYHRLGLSYSLEGVEPMSTAGARKAKESIMQGFREVRRKNGYRH